MSNRVKLLSLEEGIGFDRKPAWIVQLGFFPSDAYAEPMLTVRSVIPKADYDEADLVRIARHYFQGVCAHLAEETASWAMEKSAVEALKRDTKSPSASTANKPS